MLRVLFDTGVTCEATDTGGNSFPFTLVIRLVYLNVDAIGRTSITLISENLYEKLELSAQN